MAPLISRYIICLLKFDRENLLNCTFSKVHNPLQDSFHMATGFIGQCPTNVRVFDTFSISLDILSNNQYLLGENIF